MHQDYGLTARELEVIELRVRGHSFESIAQQMYISDLTVRNHLRNARMKIGVSNIQELIMKLYNIQLKPEFQLLLSEE